MMSTEVSSSGVVSRAVPIGATSPTRYSYWTKKEPTQEKNDRDVEEVEPKQEEQEAIDRYNIRTVMESESPPSSENSTSYEWSFEEQFKQLYELDQEEGRKEFLDDFFEFMKRRGTPVNRIPIMAKQILDLFQLYNLVVKHGGLVQVIRNKQWSKITKGLNLPSSITSAAFTLRTQYLKYLYPYECSMHGFSTPKELQAAIDSNRRDRFSSLYHTDTTLSSSREDCYPPFAVNGCEYPSIPHPHSSITNHALSQADSRYSLKRHLDMIPGKHYEGIQQEGAKVIILPDGTPGCAGEYIKKASTLRQPTKSPLTSTQDVDARKLSELDTLRSRHHVMYGGKDWDGDIRHVLQEDGRPCHYSETHMSMVCKDKTCNGNGCRAQAQEQDLRRVNGPYLTACPCSYCREYSKDSHSPQSSRFTSNESHRHITRHHMEGASALNRERPPMDMISSRNSSPSPSKKRLTVHEENEGRDGYSCPSMQIKLQDVSSSTDKGILISMDVNGNRYEGMLYPARREASHIELQSRES